MPRIALRISSCRDTRSPRSVFAQHSQKSSRGCSVGSITEGDCRRALSLSAIATALLALIQFRQAEFSMLRKKKKTLAFITTSRRRAHRQAAVSRHYFARRYVAGTSSYQMPPPAQQALSAAAAEICCHSLVRARSCDYFTGALFRASRRLAAGSPRLCPVRRHNASQSSF